MFSAEGDGISWGDREVIVFPEFNLSRVFLFQFGGDCSKLIQKLKSKKDKHVFIDVIANDKAFCFLNKQGKIYTCGSTE